MTADMPADGPVRLGSVQLPFGKRLFGWDDEAPVLWATAEPVPNAAQVWKLLAGMGQDTGLTPFLLSHLRGEPDRPWDEGELTDRCDLASVDQLDPAAVLAQSWADSLPEEMDEELAETIAPYGLDFPGLAPRQEQQLTEAETDHALAWFTPARIGLVPAARPADVLALVGYNGAVNRYGTPDQLTAALRSWEDRFGATLIEVGFDHIRLLAKRPPRTLPDAQAVAAELWAMSDEFWPIDKPRTAICDIAATAEFILRIPIWSLWLD